MASIYSTDRMLQHYYYFRENVIKMSSSGPGRSRGYAEKQEFESPHLAKQLNKTIMEEILKKIMNAKCVSMHDSNYRCYGKGCNGQCAQFQVALMELNEATAKKVKEAIDEMHFCNTVAEYEEIVR